MHPFLQYNEIAHIGMSQILNWLPPSLQPPTSTSIIPCLTITLKDIAYLQVLATKPVYIQFKWWGLKSKLMQSSLMQNYYTFYITVSLPMFLRYCTDMKVLEFQLCDFANVSIVKGYINFLLYKHWQGEFIEIVCDLKSVRNNAKIGQIKVVMEIKQKQNPLSIKRYQEVIVNPSTVYGGGNANTNNTNNIDKKTIIQNDGKYSITGTQDKNTIKNTIKNTNIDRRYCRNQQNNRNIDNHEQYAYNDDNNFIDYNIHEQQYRYNRHQVLLPTHSPIYRQPIQIKSSKYQINEHDDTKTRLFKKLRLPLPDECICDDIKPSTLNRQKLQLKQQIDMILNQQSILMDAGSDNINIQIIGWQALSKNDSNMSCRVSMPVLDREGKISRNQYYFGNGSGLIKLTMNRNHYSNREQVLKEYLTHHSIDVCVGDSYMGKVPLYRIMGSKGDILSAGVYDNRNKKQVLKGHCLMKLVQSNNTTPQQDNTKQQQNNSIKHNKQQITQENLPVEQPSYMWVYLRQVNFLQPRHHTDSNIYISLPHQPYKSKTVWRSNCPTFNQIVTVKLPVSELVLEVWNKQATQRLVGRAYLDLNTRIEYNAEVPVEDSYGRVVGYLGLCIGKGDLTAATQFINAHAGRLYDRSQGQSRDPSRYDPGTHRNKQSQEDHYHQHSNQQKHSHSHQQHPSKQDISNSNSISHQSQPQPQPQPTNITISPRIRRPQEPQLTILQLHNKIFTSYLSKNYDWFTTYTNNQLSIAQVSHLLKSICHQNNIIKFVSLYLDAQTNVIYLQHIRHSYEAFQVYYDILVQDRDRVLKKVLEALGDQGVSINQLEAGVRGKLIKSKKPDDMWRAFKEHVDELVVENLRYFYYSATVEQICDALRRFQVYETTRGEEVPTQLLSAQVLREICDVLDIDPHLHESDIKQAISQAGLELSKYQLLSLFGEIPKKLSPVSAKAKPQSQMIKSPTFGLLGTQRIMQQQQQQQQRNLMIENPSIDARTFQNKSGFSGLSGLQQKFGRPNISPINQNTHKNSIITIRFSNFQHAIEHIVINDRQFGLEGIYPDDSIELQMSKQFNYDGYILTTDDMRIQFDGPAGEWIGLMDQMGEYCGNAVFQ